MEEEYMPLTCDLCECHIINERDSYEHEPSGVLVCEECHEILLNSPTETEEDEMEELMGTLTIS